LIYLCSDRRDRKARLIILGSNNYLYIVRLFKVRSNTTRLPAQ